MAINVIVTDLRYGSQESVIVLLEDDLSGFKKAKDGTRVSDCGNFMYQVATDADIRRVESETFDRSYSRRIQAKYGVDGNWQNDRWFVEQVRPSLN